MTSTEVKASSGFWPPLPVVDHAELMLRTRSMCR